MNKNYFTKTLIIIVLIAVIGGALSSCMKSFIQTSHLNYIEKGKPIDEIDDLIGESPEDTYVFKYKNKTITVDFYEMLYNQYTTTDYRTVRHTEHKSDNTVRHYETTETKEETHYETMPFVLLYVNEKFHNAFWLTDINKQEDELTIKVADSISTTYLEMYYPEIFDEDYEEYEEEEYYDG